MHECSLFFKIKAQWEAPMRIQCWSSISKGQCSVIIDCWWTARCSFPRPRKMTRASSFVRRIMESTNPLARWWRSKSTVRNQLLSTKQRPKPLWRMKTKQAISSLSLGALVLLQHFFLSFFLLLPAKIREILSQLLVNFLAFFFSTPEVWRGSRWSCHWQDWRDSGVGVWGSRRRPHQVSFRLQNHFFQRRKSYYMRSCNFFSFRSRISMQDSARRNARMYINLI